MSMGYRDAESEYYGNDADILEYLEHYGVKRRSGRYPYGSGEDPYQHEPGFFGQVQDLRAQGFTDGQIAAQFEISQTEFKKQYSNALAEHKAATRQRIYELRDKGYGPTKIGEMMGGMSESTVRSYLNAERARRANLTSETADILKKYVDEKRYVDIGPGTELELGVTANRLDNAVALLKEQNYQVQYLRINQMGTNHKTTMTVLTPPDVTYSELLDNRYDVAAIGTEKVYDEDGGLLKCGLEPPVSIDSSRLQIRYATNDGDLNNDGNLRDGLIQIRRGVPDISIGRAQYAQVRIAVDGTHYLKGMACYADDLPPGIDIRFNTNKTVDVPMKGEKDNSVLKPLKNDPDNPFGASIKDVDQLRMAQRYYVDPKTGERKLSAINIVNEAGDWGDWSRNVPAQMLSKQMPALAKRQLDLDYADKSQEYADICALTNPTIKRKLLQEFADSCDAAAVDLKAAPFPRQATHVIVPVPSLKDNEIYAPNYPNGSTLYLIRFPHAGRFEIPELKVNNNNAEAKGMIFNAPDAVGINKATANRLSGADFDGDTVLCIPKSEKVKILTRPTLRGLKDFDPQRDYPGYPGMEPLTSANKQTEMGKVTNLITDMTFQGADDDEIARAVRHSMVIIDAEKHNLNYKQSAIDNGIQELKKKYQDKGDGHTGAGTLISRAGSETHPYARKEITYLSPYNPEKGTGNVDPETGKLIYKPTGETKTTALLREKNAEGKHDRVTVYTNKKTGDMYYYTIDKSTNKRVKVKSNGNDIYNLKTELVTQKSTQMADVDDAYKLTSGGSKQHPGTQMEDVYANYANQMKALANSARKEYLSTDRLRSNPEAKKEYAAEVDSLKGKLNNALKNAPRERQAQLLANKTYAAKLEDNPGMDSEHRGKLRSQELNRARIICNANKKKVRIDITDREWEAIQNGAVSDSFLQKILSNTDEDALKQRAMPRQSREISQTKRNLAKAMAASGYSTVDIADRLGISTKSVSSIVNEAA